AVFAFVYILLSARVIRARRHARISIGTKGDIGLERKVRVHANFAEYVPFALLLATFVEMQNGPVWLVHLACSTLLAGRLIRAFGASKDAETSLLRAAGWPPTFAAIAATALALLVRTISLLVNSS